jgi:hypothetical protein
LFWESIWPCLTMLWVIRYDVHLPNRGSIHGQVMSCEKTEYQPKLVAKSAQFCKHLCYGIGAYAVTCYAC